MQIDWWTLAIQTINFLVVVWLLRRFLYAPVQHMIDEREAADRAAAETAQKKTEAAEALKAEYEAKLATFEEDTRKRDADLHTAARSDADRMMTAARHEADELRAKAKEDIEVTRDRALSNLRDDIAKLAKDLARTALAGGPSSPEACLQATLDTQPDEAMAKMREDLSTGGVTLITAQALPPQDRTTLTSILRDRLDGAADTVFEADERLLGGIVLRLPHMVIDASVAGRLDKAAAGMTEVADDA